MSLRCVLTFRFHALVFRVLLFLPILSSETEYAFAFGLKRATCPNQHVSSFAHIHVWRGVQIMKARQKEREDWAEDVCRYRVTLRDRNVLPRRTKRIVTRSGRGL